MIKLGPEIIDQELLRHNNVGNNFTMGQPKSIPDKANDILSSKGIRDNTAYFTTKKRSGAFLNSDNVYELYATPPTSSRGNFLYFGTNGTHIYQNVGYVEISANIDTSKSALDTLGRNSNGTIIMGISTNNVKNSSQIGLTIYDTRVAFGSNSVSGIVSILQGMGTNGLSGLGWNGSVPLYVDSTGLRLGADMIPDAAGYNIGTAGAKVVVHGSVVACPLPFTESALDKLPKDVEKKLPIGQGHFGDDIKYLDIKDAPDEMKMTMKDGSKDIEIVRTVGYLYSCIKELNEKVKKVEKLTNIN